MTNITAAEFLKLWEDTDNGEGDEYEVVEEGDWTQDYKYQHLDTVYKYGSQFFLIGQSRSGSYHTDWYYDDPICEEVVPKTETIVITKYVKK